MQYVHAKRVGASALEVFKAEEHVKPLPPRRVYRVRPCVRRVLDYLLQLLARKHAVRGELREPVHKQTQKTKENLYRQRAWNRVAGVAGVRRYAKYAGGNHVELKRAAKQTRAFVGRVVVR